MERIVRLLAFAALAVSACTKNAAEVHPTPYPDCTTDGQTDCVTNATFIAVNKDLATANVSKIKSTLTIAGVTGTLVSCAADNGSGCLATSDYPSVVKANVKAENLKSGQVLAGVTGTYAPACTADGQAACMASANFPAAKSDSYTAWDIRTGKVAGGIAGKIAFYRNLADLTTYNRTAGTGSSSSTVLADIYDSIDDDNVAGAIPDMAPIAFPAIVANWLRDPTSDADKDGACNGSEECVYLDQFTNLYWAKSDATTYDWEGAIDHCDALSYGTYTDWRLPTAKEWLQAQIDRIKAEILPLGLSLSDSYHSATTFSSTTTQDWTFTIGGASLAQAKTTNTLRALCVRP